MKKTTLDEYLEALERMKKSPRDRVGILGELGVTGVGVAGGIAASGGIASAAGASTILGSAGLGSLLGGVFVATTPIGWVIVTGAAGGAIAYSATKLVRSGSKVDAMKSLDIRELEERIREMRQKANQKPTSPQKMKELISGIQLLVANGHMSQKKATDLLGAVEKKRLSIDHAFKQITRLAEEKEGSKVVPARRWQPGNRRAN